MMSASEKIFRSRWNLTRFLAKFILKIMRWKTTTIPLNFSKFVLIGAHHTSNWDFVIGYLVMSAIGLKLKWVGKHTLFRWPFGQFMRWLGGIPVNRTLSTNFIEQVVHYFHQYKQFVIAMAPEGTRRHTAYWRSGFYYIALQAQVPIVMGFLDYQKKVGGLGALFIPSGDKEADLQIIRDFFKNVHPKYPEKAGTIRFKSGV